MNKLLIGILIGLSFCFSACEKVAIDSVRNLNGDRISILGHGGMGVISPENPLPLSSMTSLLKAIEGYGAEGVDADIRMSLDSNLMLFHDPVLDLGTDCTGCLEEKMTADLIKCRYRNGIALNVFSDDKVSLLEDFIARMALRPHWPTIILDVKTDIVCGQSIARNEYLNTFARQVARLIERYNGTDWIIVDSKDLQFLRLLKQQNAQIKIIFAPDWSVNIVQDVLSEGFYGFCFRNESITFEQIAEAHNAGLRVMVWNIRDRKTTIEAINKHPDFLLTDNIPLAQQIIGD